MTIAALIGQTPATMLLNQARNGKAWRTAQDFEAQFLKSMLEQAYSGLAGEGPMGGAGTGAEAWRSFLIDEHAKSMTAKGGIGLAAQIYRDMTRMMESKNG